MTALGIDITTQDTTYDWTGLTTGHPKPIKVQEAYDDMIAAWSAHMSMADLFEIGLATHEDIARTLGAAQMADRNYQFVALTWEVSQNECTCHPVTGNACPSCTAKHYIEMGDEMPF